MALANSKQKKFSCITELDKKLDKLDRKLLSSGKQVVFDESNAGAPSLTVQDEKALANVALEPLWTLGDGLHSKPPIQKLHELADDQLIVARDSAGKLWVIRPSQVIAKGPDKVSADQQDGITLSFGSANAATNYAAFNEPKCWKQKPGSRQLLPQRFDCIRALIENRPEREIFYRHAGTRLLLRLNPGDEAIGADPLTAVAALGPKGRIEVNNPRLSDLEQLRTAKGDVLIAVDTVSGERKVLIVKSFAPEPPSWPDRRCNEASDDPPVICIDIVNGPKLVSVPKRNLIAPNRNVRVFLRHREGQAPVVELSGQRGLTIEDINRSPPGERGLGVSSDDVKTAISSTSFAPRQPGNVDLLIKEKSESTDALMRLELIVDQRYWGALRFGLGTVVGSFREYEATTVAGASTAQIRESKIPVQFELVTGFAPYLESIWHDGRGYASGENWHLAPFVGFGLVGQSNSDISALTSFHLGVEVEFMRDFSLALTAVAKRTRWLSDGYTLGSPIESGTAPETFTEPGFAFGGALVLNASPEFLQFATGSSSKEGN